MIIKSMSRKDDSFGELYDYIRKGMDGMTDQPNAYWHNTYSSFKDRERVVNDFFDNANLLKKRKNGNTLYHEILSVKVNPNIKREKHYEALYGITHDYIRMRADKCLVIGGIHDEHDHHIHMHLMISANELSSSKRVRLTKKDFSTVKKLTEEKALLNWPELEQEILIGKEKPTPDKDPPSGKAKTDKAKKTKPLNQKQKFKKRIQDIFNKSATKADFFNHLSEAKIEVYSRGKTTGFKDLVTGKNHRLKTLGLVDEFEYICSKLDPDSSQAKNDQPEKKPNEEPTFKDHTKSAFNPTEAIKDVAKEIFTGDFKERDKKIRAEKARKARKARTKVKPESQRTFRDKIGQSANEWIFGDFKEREAQARLAKWQKTYKKEQASIKATKDKTDQSAFEKAVEAGKEWVAGDFTARENRAKKSEQAKASQERKAAYIRKQKLADKKLKPDEAKAKKKERIEKWKAMKEKEQTEFEKTKPRKEQTVGENITETVKEWVFGDFTARDNRAEQERQKKIGWGKEKRP